MYSNSHTHQHKSKHTTSHYSSQTLTIHLIMASITNPSVGANTMIMEIIQRETE